jgi:hypothetical protein
VGESENFRIKFSQRFEKTYSDLIDLRYKSGSSTVQDFVELVEGFIKLLGDSPRQKPPLGHFEPFPNKTAQQGWELWKLEFTMPHLQGAAKKGRLIYLFNSSDKEVVLVWIYTHAEFKKRPEDQVLKSVLKQIMNS